MANVAKKYINAEIDRLNSMNRQYCELADMSRNLNLLALRGDLAPVFHREKEIEAIQKLLLRRTKPNALLTGPAGCGKTAIAEALAIHITNQRVEYISECAKADREYERALSKFDPEAGENAEAPQRRIVPKPPLCDAVIYDFSINSAVSGTKYRGEFEEKMQNIMKLCSRDRDIILFIDAPVFELVGNFSIGNNASNELEITVEVSPGVYKKHFVYLNEWTMYVVEDVSGCGVENYHYEVNFLPEMFIPVTFTNYD